ncbi:MAG: FtsQ-type POTRA domain-containing protein [Syntrophobacterales bacterium]|nr:FtsQ-type POTRA domain-containing protein [Syntrophobacterales bacterium]
MLALVILVTAALLFGCDLVLRASFFSVQETLVKGCSELTEKDVLSLAKVSSGANLLTINKEAIIRRISGNSWVKDVFVGREFPNRLVIWVQERNAVALIEKESMLYLIDSKGEIFKKLESDEKADLPVLTGFFSENILNRELVSKSLALLNHLKEAKEIPDIGMVSEVHGNETFGFSLFTNKGLCLQLGFEGYEAKLKRLSLVMDDMKRKNLQLGLMLIDLSNPEKINVQSRTALHPAGAGMPMAKGEKLRI